MLDTATAIINLRVHPGASKNHLKRTADGSYRAYVTAPPQKGQANRALMKLLAKQLGISPSRIELISGHVSRQKRIRITGVSTRELKQRLEGATKK